MKKFLAVCVVLFVASLWLVNADEGDEDYRRYRYKYNEVIIGNDYCVKVTGRSGRISILRRAMNEPAGNTTSNDTDSNFDKGMKKPKPCEAGPGKKLVTIDFVKMTELNKYGRAVGQYGRMKHGFRNFAKHDFNVSGVREVVYQNLSALQFAIASNIDGAEFKVYVFIFNETGNITNGEEVKPVAKGTVKFTIEINNWLFCGDNGAICRRGRRQEIGSQIELTIKIKGKKEKPDEDNTNGDDVDDDEDDDDTVKGKNTVEDDGDDKDGDDDDDDDDDEKNKNNFKENGKDKGAINGDYKIAKGSNKLKKLRKALLKLLLKKYRKQTKYICRKRRCGKKYDLGDEDKVVLFKTLQVDGNYTDMPEGYPRLEKRGPNHVFVLRFPKGQNISYDPTVDLSPVEQQILPSVAEKDPKESGSSSLASTILPVAMCLLTRLFRL